MVTVLLWCFLSIFVACIGGLLVLRVAQLAQDTTPADHHSDPFGLSVRAAFNPDDTRSGRIRLMLSAIGRREAEAVGAHTSPIGLHRATP